MKLNIYVFVFFLFYSLISQAQVISVRDKVTLERLPGVAVISGTEFSLMTDQSGNVDITIFKDSPSIKFNMIGYLSVAISYAEIAAAGWVVSLPEKSFYINEVVVSASKFEEKRDDVAQQIQVIGQTDLRFMNQQTTADVLNQSGNVMVQKSQQGGGSPIIRGFEANKVLMVVDGVRMNNAIYRGGHLQDVITLDNTIIEKMEVVFGPGSVVYGSDALGGVMHFYTRNPQFSYDSTTLVKGNAFTRLATSNQEITGHADVNFGGKKCASLSSFTYSAFDDLRQGNVRSPYQLDAWGRAEYVQRIDGKDSIVNNSNPNVQVGSGYKQYDFLQKFSFMQSKEIIHTLNLQYSTSSDVPRYDRLTQYRNGGLRFAE